MPGRGSLSAAQMERAWEFRISIPDPLRRTATEFLGRHLVGSTHAPEGLGGSFGLGGMAHNRRVSIRGGTSNPRLGLEGPARVRVDALLGQSVEIRPAEDRGSSQP